MSFETRSGRKSGRIRYYLQIEGVEQLFATGPLPTLVVGEPDVPVYDLTVAPRLYCTFENLRAGPGFQGINGGSLGTSSTYDVTSNGAGLTVGPTHGKVGNGVSVGGALGLANYANWNVAKANLAFTIGGWFRPDASGERRYPLTAYDANAGWYWERDPGTGILYIVVGAAYVHASSTALAGGVYSHVVWTYDGTTGRLYKDGALQHSFAYTAPMTTSPLQPNSIEVGWSLFGLGWFGQQDERCDDNRAWSAAEVLAAYNAGVAGNHLTYPP